MSGGGGEGMVLRTPLGLIGSVLNVGRSLFVLQKV